MSILKSIWVDCPIATSFKLFCEDIGKWWPKGPSFNGKHHTDMVLEGRVGGRVYELYSDGSEFEIGQVTTYQPPLLVAFSWRAPSWDVNTEVEIRFSPENGGTRLELEHRGFEQSPQIRASRKSYDGGWSMILGHFESQVRKSAPLKQEAVAPAPESMHK